MHFNLSSSNSPLVAGLTLCAGVLGFVPALADVIVGSAQPSATTLGQTTATQIRVQAHGTGHGLIVPYYTAQGDMATMLSVTNTDPDNGKVVKLRLRSADNGDAMLSMTLLLAPGDMWTASLRRESGQTVLSPHPKDRSCTLPSLALTDGGRLQTNRLGVSYSEEEKLNQTREGVVEYINMADIPAAAVYGEARQSQSELFQAIKHVNGVAPCGAVLQRMAENFTSESAAAGLGLAAPTGGLMGRWVIVDVPKSLTFTGNMHAVRAVDAIGNNARANFVYFPQTDTSYPVDSVDGVTADPLLRTRAYPGKNAQGVATAAATTAPAVAAMHLDFPDFSTPYTVAIGADAPLLQATQFTQAMSAKSIGHEYVLRSEVQFMTDWVMSMPARRFSAAVDSTNTAPRILYSMIPRQGNQYFHDANTEIPSSSNKKQACFKPRRYFETNLDDDGQGLGPRFVSLDPPYSRRICGMVNVLTFGTMDSTLGASATRTGRGDSDSIVSPPSNRDGWMRMDFADSVTQLGLPMLAGSFNSAVNPAIQPGISGNFGANSGHWYQR
jgi:hypothetical protein